MTGDLTDDAHCQQIVKSTIGQFKQLDVLVANAGIFDMNKLETTPMERYDKVMRLNTRTVFYLMQLSLPHLVETKGNIVTVSSIAGLRAVRSIKALQS